MLTSFRTIFAFVICIVLTTAAFSQMKAASIPFTELPLTFDGTYLLAPVKTGKLEALFVVDTAANGTVISPATRDALGFSEKDGQVVDVTGASGQVKYQALELDSFAVGEFVRPKFGVVVIDLARFKKNPEHPYAGILGNNFLSDFDLEINLPASKLRLYPHDAAGRAIIPKLDERLSVPNEAADKGFIVLKVLIEGKPVTAILDTGAPTSVLNWAAAKQSGVTTETKGLKRREKGTGGLGSQVADTYLYQFKRIKAGRTKFKTGEVRIADLTVFKTLGLGDKPAMLFGLDMLKNRALFVSYSTKKLYFYKPRS
jgi:predicted aspartyl protease